MSYYQAETDAIYDLQPGEVAPFAERFTVHRLGFEEYQIRDAAGRVAWFLWYQTIGALWHAEQLNPPRAPRPKCEAGTLGDLLDAIRQSQP